MWLGRVANPAIVAASGAPDSPIGAFATTCASANRRLMEAAVQRSGDRVAGFLCAFSFALSGIALARTPGLLAPAAILVALVAVRMTEAHRTLAAAAVAVSGLAFFLGMVIAIATDSPLF